jgi:hypothetical protein
MPMLPVSASELAQIQSDLVAAVCDKACIVRRATSETPDGAGSKSKTYTTIETTVAGMSQPTANELTNYAYEIEDKAAWTVRMPIATDAKAQDQLIIEGQTLEVHITLDPKSYPGLLSVIAAELKP